MTSEKEGYDIAETSSWMICKSCIEVLSDFKSFLNACEIIPRINLPTDKPNGLSDKLIISNATSEIVTGVFFECQYCGWKRTSKESYDRHIRFRHKDCLRASSNQDLIYKCYLCNIKKNHEVDLLQHIITKHIASKRPEIEKDKEISNSIGNQRKEQLFECYLCSEKAASKSGLICHIRASHFRNRYHWTPQSRGKLKIDNINFSNGEQQADDENNTNGLCVKNNKHLEKVYSETRRNNQRGRKINLIKTTEQSKTVKTPKKKSARQNNRDYKCTICGYSTNLKLVWFNHMRFKHTTTKHHVKLKRKLQQNNDALDPNNSIDEIGKIMVISNDEPFEQNNFIQDKAVTEDEPKIELVQKNSGIANTEAAKVTPNYKMNPMVVKLLNESTSKSDRSIVKKNSNPDEHSTENLRKRYFRCQFCDVVKLKQIALILHVRHRHSAQTNPDIGNVLNGSEKVIANSTEESSTNSGLHRFKCKFCDVVRMKKSHLNMHMNTQHPGRIQCPICQFRTNGKGAPLTNHMRFKHNKSVSFSGNDLVISDIVNGLFECYICGVKRISKSILQSHITRMHMKKRKRRTKAPTDESKTREIKKMLLECPMCSKKTATQYHLTRHSRFKNQTILKCKFCGLQLRWKDDSTVNNKGTHNNLEDEKEEISKNGYFECYMCAKIKTSRLKLIHHIESKHQDIYGDRINKLFKCYYCGTKVKRKDTLLRHIERKHQDSSQYDEVTKQDGNENCRTKHECEPVKFTCNLCGPGTECKHQDTSQYGDVNKRYGTEYGDEKGSSKHGYEPVTLICNLCGPGRECKHQDTSQYGDVNKQYGTEYGDEKSSSKHGYEPVTLICNLCGPGIECKHQETSQDGDVNKQYGTERDSEKSSLKHGCEPVTLICNICGPGRECKHQETSQDGDINKQYGTERDSEKSSLKHGCERVTLICNLCGPGRECKHKDTSQSGDVSKPHGTQYGNENSPSQHGCEPVTFTCNLSGPGRECKHRDTSQHGDVTKPCGTECDNEKSLSKHGCKDVTLICNICGPGRECKHQETSQDGDVNKQYGTERDSEKSSLKHGCERVTLICNLCGPGRECKHKDTSQSGEITKQHGTQYGNENSPSQHGCEPVTFTYNLSGPGRECKHRDTSQHGDVTKPCGTECDNEKSSSKDGCKPVTLTCNLCGPGTECKHQDTSQYDDLNKQYSTEGDNDKNSAKHGCKPVTFTYNLCDPGRETKHHDTSHYADVTKQSGTQYVNDDSPSRHGCKPFNSRSPARASKQTADQNDDKSTPDTKTFLSNSCGSKSDTKTFLCTCRHTKHDNEKSPSKHRCEPICNSCGSGIECERQSTDTFLCSSCGTEHDDKESLTKHLWELNHIYLCNICGSEDDSLCNTNDKNASLTELPESRLHEKLDVPEHESESLCTASRFSICGTPEEREHPCDKNEHPGLSESSKNEAIDQRESQFFVCSLRNVEYDTQQACCQTSIERKEEEPQIVLEKGRLEIDCVPVT
ncbi:unnamed protein product [Acanthoscelides obtectus]|uniref:C2H2-type domain-containing protein n=1 Tax=Acanthoscelides obtectus TaxID=200917 RepID=A0A9P0KTL1_ACAOB|nr:unnamed protein product [Acanthoscelides obtectus]CAK1664428.1 hypothetical protein AOBTE_LOCUS24256 [Acanthoscelides obtectus]